MRNKKYIKSFNELTENLNISDFSDGFKKKAKELIDDTKKLKDEYPDEVYNKIIKLEKLIDGDEEDRKLFVKSIMRLLGMEIWDLPHELYPYV